MQSVCFRGLLRILAGFPLNLIGPAGVFLPAGRVCSWHALTLTIRHSPPVLWASACMCKRLQCGIPAYQTMGTVCRYPSPLLLYKAVHGCKLQQCFMLLKSFFCRSAGNIFSCTVWCNNGSAHFQPISTGWHIVRFIYRS